MIFGNLEIESQLTELASTLKSVFWCKPVDLIRDSSQHPEEGKLLETSFLFQLFLSETHSWQNFENGAFS